MKCDMCEAGGTLRGAILRLINVGSVLQLLNE